MTTIAELLVEIGVEVEDAEKAEADIKALKDETKELGEGAKGATKDTKGLSDGLGKNLALGAAAAAAAIAAAAVAIFNFVNETTTAIDKTNKLATSLGLPIEELQRLEFAAGQSGVEAEKLKAGILKVNTALLDLKNGTGAAIEPLGDLGLGLKDLENLTTTERIGLIGERLQEIGDDAERSALSAKIFGEEAGPAMASLLAEGREGLKRLGDAAQNVVTQEDADRASEFQDRMGELTSFVEGLAQTIALELLPPVLEVIEGLQSWIGENQAFIDTGIDVVLTLLADIFNAVMQEVQLLVAIGRPLVEWVIDLLKRVDKVVPIFKIFRRVITALFNPLNTLIGIVETVILGLEKLGLVSEGTSDRFGRAVDKMVADSAGFDQIANKAAGASEEIDALSETQDAFTPAGKLQSEEEIAAMQERNIARFKRAQARKERQAARAARASGGGAIAKKPAKKVAKKKKQTSTVTAADIFARIFQGDAEALAEDLKGVAAQTPDVRDVQPTVAISIFNIKFESGAFQITGSDPLSTATEVAVQMERQLRGAAQSLALLKKR